MSETTKSPLAEINQREANVDDVLKESARNSRQDEGKRMGISSEAQRLMDELDIAYELPESMGVVTS